MTPARSIHLVVAIASILATAPGLAQSSDQNPVRYGLTHGGEFEWGCFGPCLCPIFVRQPMQGTFTLTQTGSDPLFDYYSVSEVRWKVPDSTTPILIEGSGTYRTGGEVARQEQLTLDLSFNGGPPQHFDSGLDPAQAPFPEIHTTISLHGEFCFDSAIVVIAKPIDVAAVGPGLNAEPLIAAPNPFQASTQLEFSLSRGSRVDLGVFDLSGRELRSLERGRWITAGRHRRSWDGRLERGGAASPGLYFIRLQTTDGVHVRGVVKLDAAR